MKRSAVAIRSLAMLVASCAIVARDSAAQSGATLRGRVIDDSGAAPLASVELTMLSAASAVRARVVSDSAGDFRIDVPRGGHYTLFARRIGYAALTTEYELTAPGERVVELRLRRQVEALPAVTTVAAPGADSRPIYLEGFERRKRLGLGTYFTREQLVAKGEPGLSQLLRGVAGVQVSGSGTRASATMSRSTGTIRCAAVVFVDGVKMNGSSDPPDVVRAVYQMLEGHTFEAVEIYLGRSQLPSEFGGPDSRCGAVAVWTRRGGTRQ